MPMPNFHASKQSSGSHKRIRVMKNKGGAGVDFVIGVRSDGKSEIRTVRFDKSKFDAAKAKAWLKKHNMKTKLESTDVQEKVELDLNQRIHLVQSAIHDEFPPQNVDEDDEHWARRFFIERAWLDKVLLRRSFRWSLESDPKIALIKYEITEEEETPAVELGDLIPMQMQAVSDDGSEVVTFESNDNEDDPDLEEAGKRNSKRDSSNINRAIQSLLDLLGDDDVADETMDAFHIKNKVRRMKKIAQKGHESCEDEHTKANDTETVLESWGQLDGENIYESFDPDPLIEAAFDDKTLVIHNSLVLGPRSKNGRKYPEATQKDAIPVFEGARAFLDHPKTKDMAETRSMRDLIGWHENVRVEKGRMISDLHLFDNASVRDHVIPVVKRNPKVAGNSILARGQMEKKKDKDGDSVVSKILAARSVDLVTEPATTNSIFSESENIFTEHMTEDSMDWKELTVEHFKKERPDLFDEIVNKIKDEQQVESIKKENLTLKKDLGEREKKIVEYEIQDALRAKQNLVAQVIAQSSLPENAKCEEVNGVKRYKQILTNVLERCENEEEMKATMTAWEEAAKNSKPAAEKPVSEEKKLDLSEKPAKVTESHVERVYHAFVQ